MLADAAHANDAAPNFTADAAGDYSSGAITRQAQLMMPLSDMLRALSVSAGVSFVFDTRLIAHKQISPINDMLAPELPLRRELKTVGLDLHRINETTFAITAHAPATIATPIAATVPQTPILIDTVIVTAMGASAALIDGARGDVDLTRAALEAISPINPAEAIFDLPQMLASVTSANTAIFGATAGVNYADLRGLGADRTVALLNGRRRTAMAPGASGLLGFDLNALATPFLERVEITGRYDGAHAGLHAASGAINFVTRRNIEGFEVGGQYGVSEHGDAQERGGYLLAGLVNQSGSASVSLGFNIASEDGLFAGDRPFSAEPAGFALDGRQSTDPQAGFVPGFGASWITPEGSIVGVIDDNDQFIFADGITGRLTLDGAGGFEPFDGRLDQLYNWAEDMRTLIPLSRKLGFIDAQIAPNETLSLFASAHIGASSARNQLAGAPALHWRGPHPQYGSGVEIDLNHPSTPDDLAEFIRAEYGENTQSIVLARRYVEVGPRQRRITRRYNEINLGAEWTISDRTQLGAYYHYGRNSALSRQDNRIDGARIAIALDDTICAEIPECAPIDFFSSNGLAESADFIRAPSSARKTLYAEHELALELDSAINAPFDRELTLALGLAARRSALRADASPPPTAALFGAFAETPADVSYWAFELYGEARAPVTKDDSRIGALDASVSFRASRSADLPDAKSVDLSLDWRPAQGIYLFAAYAFGERPPNAAELGYISDGFEEFTIDPCAADDLDAPKHQTLAQNCRSSHPLGVGAQADTGFIQTDFVVSNIAYGNPDLQAEDIANFSLGAAVTPTDWVSAVPGKLTLSVFWQDYRLSNMIKTSKDHVQACFNSPGFSSPACAINPLKGRALIERDPQTGQLAHADYTLANGGDVHWRGADMQAHYTFTPAHKTWFDGLSVNVLHTLTDRARYDQEHTDEPDQTGLVAFPHHQSRAFVGIDRGRTTLTAIAHRRGRAAVDRSGRAATQIPAITTYDLSLQYRLGEKTTLMTLVENIADRSPPLISANEGVNTYANYYDTIGRRFSVSLRTRF